MPNQITANGLETKTQSELITEFETAFKSIYGTDISLNQDDPDGQMMMIFIQATLDVLDLLQMIFSSFDPDNAFGVTLDQRVAINGIQRQAGTYTVTPITIVVSQALSIYGLNDDEDNPYTIQDNEGNQFVLIETQDFAAPGTYTANFRAKDPGKVLTQLNTITSPVTIVLGVTSVNNPTAATSIGIDEETDVTLKIRRQKSVSLPSQGYKAGLLAALENVNGVTSAFVYENHTDITDDDGTPSHTIWVIVAGTYDETEVAQAIYRKRNAGAGMRGDHTYLLTEVDGNKFLVKWDDVVTEDVYIQMELLSLDGVTPPNTDAIKEQLPSIMAPGVYEQLNTNKLSTLVQQIDPNSFVDSAGFSFSEAGPYFEILTPSAKNKQFTVASDRIFPTVAE